MRFSVGTALHASGHDTWRCAGISRAEMIAAAKVNQTSIPGHAVLVTSSHYSNGPTTVDRKALRVFTCLPLEPRTGPVRNNERDHRERRDRASTDDPEAMPQHHRHGGRARGTAFEWPLGRKVRQLGDPTYAAAELSRCSIPGPEVLVSRSQYSNGSEVVDELTTHSVQSFSSPAQASDRISPLEREEKYESGNPIKGHHMEASTDHRRGRRGAGSTERPWRFYDERNWKRRWGWLRCAHDDNRSHGDTGRGHCNDVKGRHNRLHGVSVDRVGWLTSDREPRSFGRAKFEAERSSHDR